MRTIAPVFQKLMPFRNPPPANRNLEEGPGKYEPVGISVSELGRRYQGTSDTRFEEIFRLHNRRLMEWSCWQLILTGKLSVSSPSGKHIRILGPGEVPTATMMELQERMMSKDGKRRYIWASTKTIDLYDNTINGWATEDRTTLVPEDGGLVSGAEMIKFLPDRKVLIVEGNNPIGRCWKAGFKKSISQLPPKEGGSYSYFRGEQLFKPQLDWPERIVVAG